MRPDFSANRHEIKYIMHAERAEVLRKSLSDVLIADAHTSSVSGGYYNHSIYFDSYGFQRYLEKHEGQDRRIKIRLRSYREFKDAAPRRRFLELKHRLGGIVKKDRLEITDAEGERLLRNPTTPSPGFDSGSTVARTFMYHANNSLLRPVVSLQYHRTAYYSPIYPGVRITFDRMFVAARDVTLPEHQTAVPSIPAINPNLRIVELKYNNQVPRVFLERFRAHDLRQVTFSKYATAIEAVTLSITDQIARASQQAFS